MRKALFLDKDGTLLVDVPYNVDPEKVTFYPGVKETLQELRNKGYLFILITNQSGIGKGLFSEEDLQNLFDYLQRELNEYGVQLDDIYYCPHLDEECDCRKPKPGMIEKAAKKWDIDLKQSWMIGDILHDVEAGNRAGCRTIHIDNGNETERNLSSMRVPHKTVKEFKELTTVITH